MVVDCSGSMRDAIDDVRNHLAKFMVELGDTEYGSVIIFSGHDRAKLIAGPTQCNEQGRKLLMRAIEKEVRILDTTVFSEPLALCLETAMTLSGEDTVTNGVLFTDGCAVPTKWSIDREQEKSFEIARKFREAGVVLSSIGYGVYYDESFLSKLREEAGGSGIFRHVSDIESFGPTIAAIRDTFQKISLTDLSLSFTPDAGTAGRIYRTMPEVLIGGDNGKLSTQALYEGKVSFFLDLTAEANNMLVSGKVSGKDIGVSVPVEPLTDEQRANFVRVLGAYAFLSGDRDGAAELFGMTGDDGVAEKAASSYTDREQRETGDMFRRAFSGKRFIGAGLKPTGPSHNVLNVLRILIEGKGTVVYIPKGAYKRSGERTIDPRVIHDSSRVLKVVNYKSHESRFNFSLTCIKDVKVLPEAGDGEPVSMKVWRTYNVILDGNLHLPMLEASLGSADDFARLKEAGVVRTEAPYSRNEVYTLHLDSLKMISSDWAKPAVLGFGKLLREEAELEAEQKALNARRKETKAATGAPTEEEGDFYHEQAKRDENAVSEFYGAACVEVKLMKYKPKEYDASTLSYEQATERVLAVRQRLTEVRFLKRAIVFAMEKTNSKSISWGKEKTTKFGKTEQLATYQGMQLKRVTWTEQCVCS